MRAGLLKGGGYECELDVVAFNPETKHLVQVEPSMDASSWGIREARYRKKFEAGKKHIPTLFSGLALPSEIEQIALFVFGSSKNRTTIGGGQILMISDLMREIREEMTGRRVANAAVPEQHPILRALQFAANYW